MSYISLLVPAFYVRETEEDEIKKICCLQFDKSINEIELMKISDGNMIDKDNHLWAIKFNESDLCLTKIEELLYQRDCIKSLVEKTFESLQSMSDKLSCLEKELKTTTENKCEEDQSETLSDNQKLKDLLSLQLENSENFRVNTEKTLNRIKHEFHQMVLELDVLRKSSSKHKSVKSLDLQENKKSQNSNSKSSNISESQKVKKNIPKLKLNDNK